MEFIIIVFIVWLIYKGITSQSSQTNSTSTYNSNQKNFDKPFNARVSKGRFNNLDTFDVSIIGGIKFNYQTNVVVIKVEMYDEKDAVKYPILCQIEELSATDAPIFQYVSKAFNINSREGAYANWTSVVSVPIDALTFPFRGYRKLIFKVSVLSANNSGGLDVVKSSTYNQYHQVDYVGYYERDKFSKEFNKNLAALASELSYADGKIDKKEIFFIKDRLINKIYKKDKERENKELTKYFDEKIEKVESYSGSMIDRVVTIANKMISISDQKQRIEAVEFLINLATIDGNLDQNELTILDKIAEVFKISKQKLNDLKIKIIPPDLSNAEDVSKEYLNLDKYKTVEDKKKYLRDLYREWNPLITSNDELTRKKAEQIIKLIAIERSKLSEH